MTESDFDGAAERLAQASQRAASLANGDEPWTVICDEWHREHDANGGRFVAFADPSIRDEVLENSSWDLMKGHGGPGFAQHHENGEWVTTYERNSEGPHLEPLLILQDFWGVVPSPYLVSQEFVLLMHLWEDKATGNYYEVRDDGSRELAIVVDGEQIRIRTPLLRRYQAARQLDLILFTDSIVHVKTDEKEDAFECLNEAQHVVAGSNQVSLYVGDIRMGDGGLFSRLMVKRVLPPPPRETSGIWPWDREDEVYPEFIIGEDNNGRPVRFTCEEKNLANYFGANPDAPHYLTPVFFKREVLQRYYDNPTLYSISEGTLSCAGLWGVQIDNDNPDHVMVFLGDLGRDVPNSERTHWLAHNVVPAGRQMSETTFRRSFLAQWAATTNPEHMFKQTYKSHREAWKQTWGWDLYRKPTGADAQLIQRLRIPINDSDGEFEAQILNLAKLLVDLLNERQLVFDLPPVDNERGISKFERFLTSVGFANVVPVAALLRRIQTLRSRLAAHTSGADGQAWLAKELNGLTKPEFVKMLMGEAKQMLDELAQFEPPTSADSAGPRD
ncbi:hypothetical protein [Demequina sp.]|uniref:hypothetical protein n=1 Tax=Demequina sp. TaxID=2050685 RepID=UPI0025BDB349|nr:hypothetical protein [Demequina sp.]